MDPVLSPYRTVLSHPGAPAFALAGLLSRLPISMFNISVILMVQIQYDSYSMAGRVAAIGVLVWSLQTVPTARLTDRLGQRAAMIPLTLLFVLGSALTVATAMSHGPEWLLWIGVALGSMSGPLGSLTRARWSHLLERDEDIHTAFALESTLDELLFISGPALATILATAVWPPLGIIVCAVGMVIGMTLLLAQRSTEPPPRTDGDGASLGWRIPPAVLGVSVISAGIGLLFGAFDISVVAFAEEQGHKQLSGVLIAILSAGSLLGGLIYGSRHWRAPLWQRTLATTGALALGFGALSLSGNLLVFAVLGFVAGIAIAPTITNADTVVQRVVRRDQITEGMAWLRIGLGIGVSAGAWGAGHLIETSGAQTGLHLAAGAGLLTFVIALAMVGTIRRGTRRPGAESIEAHGPAAREADDFVEQPPTPPNV
ncbi:MFS transporter [Demequina pelophila]|uniref:MFS transporter n=1 Tax=Demequina pelophila TaxID=1638984 RepID=UPI0009E496CD|nr:MFS transporter [Demequina pelophila]